MNIACIACPARYAISDEKIVGRKVRIGCKRCGTKLVIDGTVTPPDVRADGAPSVPPDERYHLAISQDQRERGDVARIVELYGRGAIVAATLAWREGMPQWQSLFEIEPIAQALRAAGYSPNQAGSPSYVDDDAETHIGGGYADDDDEQTHVAKSPLEGALGPHRFDDDDDEATAIFDADAVRGGAWSEPASWRDNARQNPLATGEWRERGQAPAAERPASKPPGAWEERGFEDDEVTRMVAPLEERAERFREPRFSGPGFELRRPKSSAAPPSSPPDEAAKLTDQRGEDSVLFTLERLAKQKPAPNASRERAELDFSDVAPISLAPPVAGPDLVAALSTAPPPPPRPPEPPRDVEAAEPLAAPPRRSRWWLSLAVLLLAVAGAAAALYATGRWPLVTATAAGLWHRVQGSR